MTVEVACGIGTLTSFSRICLGFLVKLYGSGADREVREHFSLISSNFRPKRSRGHPKHVKKLFQKLILDSFLKAPCPVVLLRLSNPAGQEHIKKP